MYLVITYITVIGLGFYAYYVLYNKTALVAAFFLPILIVLLVKLYNEWAKNQYQVLADIADYNKRVEKVMKIIEKKESALKNSKK